MATGPAFKSGLTNSMLPFNITFSPTIAILTGRIDKLGLDIKSFKVPLTRSIEEVMTKSITKNFNVGGRPRWEPLSEATLLIRAQYSNPNTDPLIWTGELRSVAGQVNIWTITDKSAMIRGLPQNVWYGAIHQKGYGGRGGSAKGKDLSHAGQIASAAGKGGRYTVSAIPARPWAVIQPEDEEDIKDIFIEWLGEQVDAAGLG